MIEAIQTFLDLDIEPRGAMLSLGVLNPEVMSFFGLDNIRSTIREVVAVFFCILDQGMVFAVFHQMADG